MNCTSTHTTGPRRGSDEPLCRKSGHHNRYCREPRFEETDQVWAEAGFLPPAGYRQIVALLHRLAMDEEISTPQLSSALTAAAKSGDAGHGYRILDPAKLRRTAIEYGIKPAGGDDAGIAHAVTLAIIGEYVEETA